MEVCINISVCALACEAEDTCAQLRVRMNYIYNWYYNLQLYMNDDILNVGNNKKKNISSVHCTEKFEFNFCPIVNLER